MTEIATVFGGTGFVGHTLVQALAALGYEVRIPTRNPEKAHDLMLMGHVGQIRTFRCSPRSDEAVAKAVRGASLVVNLIGTMENKGRDNFQAIHVETAARIARLSLAAGVKDFIHISALGAQSRAKSRYAKTKGLGEDAVKAFFPHVVILRPSLLFGPRDRFFNLFALIARFSPFLPLIGGGQTRFQPLYVGDLTAAILSCIKNRQTRGKTFLLGGDEIFTFQEMMKIMLEVQNLKRRFITLPWSASFLLARFLSFLPAPPLTPEQVTLLQKDNVIGTRLKGRDESMSLEDGTLQALGLTPTPLRQILPRFLPRY